MISPNVERVVSLGSDVIVRTDLAKLVNHLSNEYSIGGVNIPQFHIDRCNNNPKLKAYYDSVGWDVANGFNTDVLIFNLKKIRGEKTLPDKALNYLHEHPNTRELEQEVFNIIFKDDIYYLDERYNLLTGWDTISPSTKSITDFHDTILHYCGGIKPWDIYMGIADLEYWYYLSLTPWGDNGQAFLLMRNVLPTTSDITMDIDRWIDIYPLKMKIRVLLRLTIPLYWKILMYYKRHYL